MTDRDWAILKSLYDGETACLDQRIGLLFDHLQKGGFLDNTIVIVMSDHGDLLDRRGMMGHHLALYDELIHTPLIIRWPGVVPAGERFSGFVQICDWLPTLLEIAGLADPPVNVAAQGISLVPTWQGRPIREFIVAEYMKPLQTIERALRHDPEFDYRIWLRRLKTIRKHDMKYIWASDGDDRLFDLEADPGERLNLIDKKPAVAAELRQQLERFLSTLKRRDFGDAMRNHGFRNVRWENVDRLKAWGIYREMEPR